MGIWSKKKNIVTFKQIAGVLSYLSIYLKFILPWITK